MIPFATKLREHGVDAWVDQWEIQLGDSLVSKIFDIGLAGADAVVVVLSQASVGRPWVAEELDAAIVQRINGASRLIPIVLDGLDHNSDIPASVRHLKQLVVSDLSDLDVVVDEVLRTIYGQSTAPPLGKPPAYTREPVAPLDGLDRLDSLTLRVIGSEAVRDYGENFRTAEFLATAENEFGATQAQLIESLIALNDAGLINIARTFGPGVDGMSSFTVTPKGLDAYLCSYVAEYPRWQQTVMARVADWPNGQGSQGELTQALEDVPPMVTHHMLTLMESNGWVRMSGGTNAHRRHFFGVSPRLHRQLAAKQ